MEPGLLNALTAGVSSAVPAYQQAKQNAQEQALRQRQQRLQLAQSGFQEGEDGSLSMTPQASDRAALERATTQAGLLRSGFKAAKNPETGEYDLERVAGFEGKEDEIKQLQKQKLLNDLKEGKKPSAGEYAAAGYAKRLEQAENVFGDLQGKGYDPTSMRAQAEGMLPGFLGGLKSSNQQQQEQAQRNFVNAVLRRESGAAISPSEFDSAAKQYFPSAGDSAEVLKQKALNRSIALANLKAEGAKAYDKSPSVEMLASKLPSFEKKSKGLIPEAVASERAPKVGYVEAGYEFKGGDPSDQKNWKKVQ